MSVIHFPDGQLLIPQIKAVAAFALWRTRRFDTLEIGQALDLPEAAIVFLIDRVREHGRNGEGGAA